MQRRTSSPWVLVTLLATLAACSSQPGQVAPVHSADGSSVAAASRTTTIPARLAQPRIAERDPRRPAYDRAEWQPHGWADADHDGCNTRAEVLKLESSVRVATKAGNCTVLTGAWADPYTGRTTTSAADLQIDHLVALSDAAASGGWAWPAERKVAFANDLADEWELNAVTAAENTRKGDLGPDRWSPPLASFHCAYVAAYAAIKARWDLAVTASQWAAILDVWRSCP